MCNNILDCTFKCVYMPRISEKTDGNLFFFSFFLYICVYISNRDCIQNNKKVSFHFTGMDINLNDHGWHIFPAFYRGNVISFVPLCCFITRYSQTQSYPYIFDRHFQMTRSFIHELGQLWWTDH